MKYTLEAQDADAWIEYVKSEGNKTEILSYAKEEREATLIGAVYDKNGSLVFAESSKISLSPIPTYGDVTFDGDITGYSVCLFIWEDVNSLVPAGIKGSSKSFAGKKNAEITFVSQEPESQNGKMNTIDKDTSTVWASNGEAEIVLDIGEVMPLERVRLAFAKYNDARYIPFEVWTSEDCDTWDLVYKGRSVPFSGEFMEFLTTNSARYVKLKVFGNTVSGWSSVSEIEIY